MGKLFEVNKKRILAGVPRSVGSDPTRLLSIAYNSIIYNEKLVKCTHDSLLGGVMEALKMGITIGGPMQESWLIPFSNRKQVNGQWVAVMEATLVVGYQGMRNIMDRGNGVLDLHPRAVGHKDEFRYCFGDEPRIHHVPAGPAPLKEDELRAVYAVARLRGGGKQMEVLEKSEVDAHRARSRAAASGPWVTDYVPMALKTAIRKLAKYVPKSSEILSRALELDEKADRGEPQDFELPEGAETFDVQAQALGPAHSDALDALDGALKGKRPEPVPVDRQEPR